MTRAHTPRAVSVSAASPVLVPLARCMLHVAARQTSSLRESFVQQQPPSERATSD
eukprot:CAMPEP_0180329506 /NCGR_PEP_ID=MMETSP0988-20121125/40815_1 /TAXON_ID=697907 /ORGANISM="non described non described, Strain CCMP2293" /LENGTH=54 /DNA_ID=CAMNT_0022316649 /DNA_START=180 /DNA_END=344 /DNA_ORIENTATION=-